MNFLYSHFLIEIVSNLNLLQILSQFKLLEKSKCKQNFFWHDGRELVDLHMEMLFSIFSDPFYYKNFRKYYYSQHSLQVRDRF